MPTTEKDKRTISPLEAQPVLDAEPRKPVDDTKVADLVSDFVAYGGLVQDRLPSINEVRDNTMVIVEKDGFKFLYMAVDGKWERIKVLHNSYKNMTLKGAGGRLPASSAPTWTSYKTVFEVLSYATGNYELFSLILPEDWVAGSVLYPELHLIAPTAGAGVGAENIQWKIDYHWANENESFGSAITITGSTVDIQNIVADRHFRYKFPIINGEGKKPESVMHFRLTRNSVTNNYSSGLYFLDLNFHSLFQESGAQTSETEYIKINE